jgi:hypothetical protein
LPVFHRISITVNPEAENLMIVPPLDDSIQDKITLCRCAAAAQTLSEDRSKNMARAIDELPALLYHCWEMPIPKEWADPRFGCKSWHEPSLLEILKPSEPHNRLLELIDGLKWPDVEPGEPVPTRKPWTGGADQLHKDLEGGPFPKAVQQLLYFNGACGTYLGRLKAKNKRVNSRVLHGKTIWTINPPPYEPIQS